MGAHRDTDLRNCGAATIASQSTVYVNGLAWAVEGDPETHGAGNLIAATGDKNVYIEGKLVIVVTDQATDDAAGHPPPETYPQTSSGDVLAYGK